jgi:hypothetical protein
VRKAVRLAPIFLNEIKGNISCLASIIYNISEKEKAAKFNDLSGANFTGEKLVNELFLRDVFREIQRKKLLKELFKESTRKRGQSIKRELINEPSESEPMKLVNQLKKIYKNDDVV